MVPSFAADSDVCSRLPRFRQHIVKLHVNASCMCAAARVMLAVVRLRSRSVGGRRVGLVGVVSVLAEALLHMDSQKAVCLLVWYTCRLIQFEALWGF